jgi:ketosteroid isomerase-like protein
MTTSLPPAIAAFVTATNAADTDAFLAAFGDDATLNDWGREFSGHDGIARWNQTDNIGKQAHFEVGGIREEEADALYIVTLTVSGNGYNGTGDMSFRLRGGLITEVLIS